MKGTKTEHNGAILGVLMCGALLLFWSVQIFYFLISKMYTMFYIVSIVNIRV